MWIHVFTYEHYPPFKLYVDIYLPLKTIHHLSYMLIYIYLWHYRPFKLYVDIYLPMTLLTILIYLPMKTIDRFNIFTYENCRPF